MNSSVAHDCRRIVMHSIQRNRKFYPFVRTVNMCYRSCRLTRSKKYTF